MAHEIYWERQTKPDMCRLYALNAFFGSHYITEENFNKLWELYKSEYPEYKGSNDYIFIPTNRVTFIHYVLSIDPDRTIKCEYVPAAKWNQGEHIKQILKKRKLSIDQFIGGSDWVFVFNQNHIWGIKKIEKEWFKVDSLSGTMKTSLNLLLNENFGLIIPRVKTDVIKLLKNIQIYLRFTLQNEKILDKQQFFDFIKPDGGMIIVHTYVFCEFINNSSFQDNNIDIIYQRLRYLGPPYAIEFSTDLYNLINRIINLYIE